MGNEVDFLPADQQKSFLQIDSISLDVHSANLAKGTQNNKLQYLKENINNQIYFCLQINAKGILCVVRYAQSSQKFAMYLHYLKKELRDEVNFLHVD